MIPSSINGNLIVNMFSHFDFDISDYDLEDRDFSKYNDKLIGFFVSVQTNQEDWGKSEEDLTIGGISVLATDGKIAYIHNLKKFFQNGIINLDYLTNFYKEELTDLFNSISIKDIQLESPLYQLDSLKALEPDFLNYTKQELKSQKKFKKYMVDLAEGRISAQEIEITMTNF
jgi:hypothetical protein